MYLTINNSQYKCLINYVWCTYLRMIDTHRKLQIVRELVINLHLEPGSVITGTAISGHEKTKLVVDIVVTSQNSGRQMDITAVQELKHLVIEHKPSTRHGKQAQ